MLESERNHPVALSLCGSIHPNANLKLPLSELVVLPACKWQTHPTTKQYSILKPSVRNLNKQIVKKASSWGLLLQVKSSSDPGP